MKKIIFTLTLIAFIKSLFAQSIITNNFPVLKGAYLGQKRPGQTPELFAPGIISNGLANRDVAISPDGKEMYFGTHTSTYNYSTIIFTKPSV